MGAQWLRDVSIGTLNFNQSPTKHSSDPRVGDIGKEIETHTHTI